MKLKYFAILILSPDHWEVVSARLKAIGYSVKLEWYGRFYVLFHPDVAETRNLWTVEDEEVEIVPTDEIFRSLNNRTPQGVLTNIKAILNSDFSAEKAIDRIKKLCNINP